MANILILDDEKNIRITLCQALAGEGTKISEAANLREAEELLAMQDFDLALVDVQLPDGTGIEFFRKARVTQPELQVIIITGAATISQAVEAIRLGAFEILEKPLSLHRTRLSVQNALQLKSAQKTGDQYWASLDRKYRMVGKSAVLADLCGRIAKVSPSQSRVFITGESGTGKELVAYAIHRASLRRQGPFVRFNVAAVPRDLVESELFGHEKGAFTGAAQRKIGRFEQANGGTLLLDEIGDMDLSMQAKILRALQENEFERLGGSSPIRVDVRVLAATNKDPVKLISEGQFREDLYYRLNVFPIHIAPLRERLEDIPDLVEHFTSLFCDENGRITVPCWDHAALERFCNYGFPGNIRQLRNWVERTLLENPEANRISPEMLDPFFVSSGRQEGESGLLLQTEALGDAKKRLEKAYIETQLSKNNWNVSATARALGMEQPNLSKKIKQLGIIRKAD